MDTMQKELKDAFRVYDRSTIIFTFKQKVPFIQSYILLSIKFIFGSLAVLIIQLYSHHSYEFVIIIIKRLCLEQGGSRIHFDRDFEGPDM